MEEKQQLMIKNLVRILNSTYDERFASFCRILKGNMEAFALNLRQNGIIGDDIFEKKEYSTMVSQFKAGLEFKRDWIAVEQYCQKFLDSLSKSGPQPQEAAEQLKESWQKAVLREMGMMFLHVEVTRTGITGKPHDEKGVEDTDDGRSPKTMKGEDGFLAESIRSCKVRDTSVSWDDIVGLENAKRLLEEIVVLPEERPDHFVGLRTPTKGVLLFGPPGNGKTLLAKAVAHESKSTFFNISGATLLSKWVGESEKLVKTLFDEARKCQPAVIFIDEIDSLLIRDEKNFMRRFVNELLQQLDGMTTSKSDRILVMGATNRPKDIDEAALRRFPKRIYIPLPNEKARALVLQKLLKNNKHEISDANLLDIARKTENYSFSDMTDLAEDASHGPRRELPTEVFRNTPDDQIRPIQYKDFINSLSKIRTSVKDETIKELEEWDQKYGSQFGNSTSPSLEEPKSDSDVSYIN